jgi:hypothetical protein
MHRASACEHPLLIYLAVGAAADSNPVQLHRFPLQKIVLI